MDMQDVNAFQSQLLGKFTTLRAAAFGLGGTIGADFAREASREWKSRGFGGLASACFNLSQAVKDTAGAYNVYEKARDLAVAFAAQESTAA